MDTLSCRLLGPAIELYRSANFIMALKVGGNKAVLCELNSLTTACATC